MKPLLRWVGGKTRLLPAINELIGPRTIKDYYEPCLGGGALFFGLEDRINGIACLSDINRKLMCTYIAVRDMHKEVYDELSYLRSVPYTTIRLAFNKTDPIVGPSYAAAFLALNHMCFNGLWRENQDGGFNVPLGRGAKSATFPKGKARTLESFDFTSIKKVSIALQRTGLWSAPLTVPVGTPGPGDLEFFDPPYLGEFSNYHKSKFGLEQHQQLAERAKRDAANGAFVIVCGSNSPASWAIYGKPTVVVTLSRTVGASLRDKATEGIYVYAQGL